MSDDKKVTDFSPEEVARMVRQIGRAWVKAHEEMTSAMYRFQNAWNHILTPEFREALARAAEEKCESKPVSQNERHNPLAENCVKRGSGWLHGQNCRTCEVKCHCGREIYSWDGEQTRGMCQECDAVRCDLPETQCPYAVENGQFALFDNDYSQYSWGEVRDFSVLNEEQQEYAQASNVREEVEKMQVAAQEVAKKHGL
jgi:hypothetical protein